MPGSPQTAGRIAGWRRLFARLSDAFRKRDWFGILLELTIVTVGVLVALFAEQLVQDWSWRDKVRTAEQAMRRELLWNNAPQIYQRAVMHPCVQRKLDEIRAAVDAARSRQEVANLISGFQLRFITFDSLAIQAAFASDVAAHMPQKTLHAYVDAYSVIPMLDRTNALEAIDAAKLQALRRTGGPLSAEEKDRVLEAVEALRNHDTMMWEGARWALPSLKRLGGQIDPVRKQAFMNFARHHYGACIRDLPEDWSDWAKSPFHPDKYRRQERR